ncbi:MAG: hypothetical protein ABR955_00385 [Verrucomicrobiota bacterium]|jgi:ABC-type proline/glycine betaine transport system permease subunit
MADGLKGKFQTVNCTTNECQDWPGLLLGIGMSAASFKFERRLNKLRVGMQSFVYLLIPFVGLLAAHLAPVLLALIIFGCK